jgi:hypothetical protein
MNEFEKILDASRDFFSSPEEEREVIDLIRRDPDAILSGMHKPFMKKLASAIIHGRTVGVKEMLDQEARFQTALEKFRSDTFSCFEELRGSIDYIKRMLSDRDAHIQRLERDISGAHDKLKEEIAEQFTSVHQLLKKQHQTLLYCCAELGFAPESDDEGESVPTSLIATKWSSAYAKYPDPCDTSIPLELVQHSAVDGIADAQYYLYVMLGQQCMFDRFWHIRMEWLEKAAKQRHVKSLETLLVHHQSINHMQEREYLIEMKKQSNKKKCYMQYLLVETGELPLFEVLQENWAVGLNNTYIWKKGLPRRLSGTSTNHVCMGVKERLKMLMKSKYAEGSPGYERCKTLINTIRGTLAPDDHAMFDTI